MAEAPLKDQDAVEAIQKLNLVPQAGDEDQDVGAPEDAAADDQHDGPDDADDGNDIAAPHWWDAEAKTAFSDIPNTPAARDYARKIQQYVAEAEAKREAVTQRLKTEAKGHIDAAKSAVAALNGAAPGEVDQFHSDYHDIDWAQMPKWAQENPAEAASFFAQYNARRGRVEQLLHARAAAEHVANHAFAQEQGARLHEIAPDLATNHDHLRALGDYARGTGLPAEAMKQASADELVILNKARLWDEAQARTAAAVKNPKAQASQTVKPVAAQVSGTHAQRTYAAARDKALKSRKDDDAVAAILAGGF